MKHFMPLLMLGFGVALAIVIGQRMSSDAMAVVIGVAVGVSASVPTSLLLVALLRKGQPGYQQQSPTAVNPCPQLPPQQPNIVVLDPSQFGKGQWQMPLPPPEYAAPEGGMRRLKVIGDDDGWAGKDW